MIKEAIAKAVEGRDLTQEEMEGSMEGIVNTEVKEMLDGKEDFFLLDVRSPGEVEEAAIEGAVNIPLGKVRGSIGEIPADKPVVVFCALSLRGYEASLVLRNAGRSDVKVMEGGVAMWPFPTVRGAR